MINGTLPQQVIRGVNTLTCSYVLRYRELNSRNMLFNTNRYIIERILLKLRDTLRIL